jgi:drug/metabolite transporter (DMT)-like permease
VKNYGHIHNTWGKDTIPDVWQIISFGIGFAIVLSALYAIGISRGRHVSQKAWVIVWFAFSIALAAFIFTTFMCQPHLISTSLGAAVGYIAAVASHTLKHTLDELKKGGTVS